MPFWGFRGVQARTVWGELDESNGSQLLAEFFQDDHALEEGLVVQPEGDSTGVTAVSVRSVPSGTSQYLRDYPGTDTSEGL